MEIRIFNVGPIKEFTFDLSKELIVIYGENNIGKSYAISVVYLVLKRLLDIDFSRVEQLIDRGSDSQESQDLEKQIRKKSDCNITGPVCKIIKKILDDLLAKDLEKAFINTFGPINRVKNVKAKKHPVIQIKILKHIIHVELGQNLQINEFSPGKDIFGKFTQDDNAYKDSADCYELTINDSDIGFKDRLKLFISHLLKPMLLNVSEVFRRLYFFPASRSGLNKAMQSFFPIFAELSQHRAEPMAADI